VCQSTIAARQPTCSPDRAGAPSGPLCLGAARAFGGPLEVLQPGGILVGLLRADFAAQRAEAGEVFRRNRDVVLFDALGEVGVAFGDVAFLGKFSTVSGTTKFQKACHTAALVELQDGLDAVVWRVDVRIVARREERLVGAGLLFVPADAGDDAVDIVLLERVVERDRLQQVVTDVGVEQEGELVLLVLEDVLDVVLVVLGEFRDVDVVVAGLEAAFVDVLADVLVARVDDLEVPLVGPVVDEVVDLVEVLVVVDEDRRRYLEIESVGDLLDEVQRERRVLCRRST